MPVYIYTCSRCGSRREEPFPSYTRRTRSVRCECGSRAIYDFASTASGVGAMSTRWATGHRSKAMGVHPAQAAEEQARLRRETGYSQIEVCPRTGQVITYSQKMKVAAAKASGMVDLDGGYTS
jgi:DNA-directed RNA polymerase subunit RPC12/RpoP